jgi:CsoR family transcriptional regulator, copper-sensing transcriptional repressor
VKHATHKSAVPRLRRVEGQVRGIVQMVEDERYCIDILMQIKAARAALQRVADGILKEHVVNCVDGAITSGNARDQRAKVAELLAVLDGASLGDRRG